MAENRLPLGGEVLYFPELFTRPEREEFLTALISEIEWSQSPIVLFGREILQPRLTAWYGDPGATYRYSGKTQIPKPWTPVLLSIKARVESVAKTNFNSVLLNQYRDGRDSMGWHRDNEKELGKNPTIASVTFGSTREFRLRRYREKDLGVSIPLEDGSLLLMRGESQTIWEHSVPKTKKVLDARINLTFRRVST